jgi:hypothetical protein
VPHIPSPTRYFEKKGGKKNHLQEFLVSLHLFALDKPHHMRVNIRVAWEHISGEVEGGGKEKKKK